MKRTPPIDRLVFTRRSFLSTVGLGAVASAGCSGRSGPTPGDVVAGPDGRLVFEPAERTIEVGDSVTWYFETAGHNVCARPADSEMVRLPEGASPFSSYGADESAMTLAPQGETYQHRFERSGAYQYVCIPHQSSGMIGRVIVEE